jgi:hypothetical protein
LDCIDTLDSDRAVARSTSSVASRRTWKVVADVAATVRRPFAMSCVRNASRPGTKRMKRPIERQVVNVTEPKDSTVAGIADVIHVAHWPEKTGRKR